MSSKQVDRQELLRPFLRAMTGEAVPQAELVRAGRMIANALVKHGRPVTICGDGDWAGVWNLERLTDGEAVAWGMWVTAKARRL
jgi:hypothetical protein